MNDLKNLHMIAVECPFTATSQIGQQIVNKIALLNVRQKKSLKMETKTWEMPPHIYGK